VGTSTAVRSASEANWALWWSFRKLKTVGRNLSTCKRVSGANSTGITAPPTCKRVGGANSTCLTAPPTRQSIQE
jgi:hypothetical protein